MYVEQIMTRDVVTVSEQTKLSRMSELMKLHKLRHLPVVDDDGGLVGIVSHRDVQRAEPSPITTLDIGEIKYLLSKVTASQIMRRKALTCSPDTLVEEAGCLMRQHRVGCLPVIRDARLVGIITGVDLVDFFLQITGCNVADAARITVRLADEPGRLAALLNAIGERGGQIVTAVIPTMVDEGGQRFAILRFRDHDIPGTIDAVRAQGFEVTGIDLPV